ncbi:juvenile hormone acid O-methyltransferase [Ixodes scapularis]|uniref:juvenile hormone acid O-methyltransferase n=1 Tax=Ixodes scapularis TaxID=6945 RepID=UPI001C37E875|nr:juvenile hormone acid O-methyltransferase [Ixodes scapularis]
MATLARQFSMQYTLNGGEDCLYFIIAMNKQTGMSVLEPKIYTEATGRIWPLFIMDGLDAMKGVYSKTAKDDQQFLDLGCGPGDITRDSLLPYCLPCRRVVAVDVSSDMVEFAKTHFAHPKISYDVLNIVADDVADFVERYGQFERVYSFYCFNWVKNFEKAFKNLAELMKPGAECMLWFFSTSPPIRFRQKLIKMEQWKKYAEICENCIPPTAGMNGKEEIISYISGLLNSLNLKPSICNVTHAKLRDFTSPEAITKELLAFNPLITLLTEEEESELLKEATKEATELWAQQEAQGYPIMYEVVAVCATKPRA